MSDRSPRLSDEDPDEYPGRFQDPSRDPPDRDPGPEPEEIEGAYPDSTRDPSAADLDDDRGLYEDQPSPSDEHYLTDEWAERMHGEDPDAPDLGPRVHAAIADLQSLLPFPDDRTPDELRLGTAINQIGAAAYSRPDVLAVLERLAADPSFMERPGFLERMEELAATVSSGAERERSAGSEGEPADVSPTARFAEHIQLHGTRHLLSEHDPRPVWIDDGVDYSSGEIPAHLQAAFDQLGAAFDDALDVATPEGYKMGDEREGFLYDLVSAAHHRVTHKEREIRDLTAQVRDLTKTQGERTREENSNSASLQLEQATARLETAAAKRDAFERIRDFMADMYLHHAGKAWTPSGKRANARTLVSQTSAVASVIDGRQYLKARQNRLNVPEIPEGTLIAVTGGRIGPGHKTIVETLDALKRQHPDMILAHGNAPGVQRAAAKWAKMRNVPQVQFLPEFEKYDSPKIAAMRRDDAIIHACPSAVVSFTAIGERVPRMHDEALRHNIRAENHTQPPQSRQEGAEKTIPHDLPDSSDQARRPTAREQAVADSFIASAQRERPTLEAHQDDAHSQTAPSRTPHSLPDRAATHAGSVDHPDNARRIHDIGARLATFMPPLSDWSAEDQQHASTINDLVAAAHTRPDLADHLDRLADTTAYPPSNQFFDQLKQLATTLAPDHARVTRQARAHDAFVALTDSFNADPAAHDLALHDVAHGGGDLYHQDRKIGFIERVIAAGGGYPVDSHLLQLDRDPGHVYVIPPGKDPAAETQAILDRQPIATHVHLTASADEPRARRAQPEEQALADSFLARSNGRDGSCDTPRDISTAEAFQSLIESALPADNHLSEETARYGHDDQHPLRKTLMNRFLGAVDSVISGHHGAEDQLSDHRKNGIELAQQDTGSDIDLNRQQEHADKSHYTSDSLSTLHAFQDELSAYYEETTGEKWTPPAPEPTYRGRHITAATAEATNLVERLEQERYQARLPEGRPIAVTALGNAADRDTVFETLDRVHAARPDIWLAHGGGRGTLQHVTDWAKSRGVEQVHFEPDWNSPKNSRYLERDQKILSINPAGVIEFRSGEKTTFLADEARRRDDLRAKILPIDSTPMHGAGHQRHDSQQRSATEEQSQQHTEQVSAGLSY